MSKILCTKPLPNEFNLSNLLNNIPRNVDLTLYKDDVGYWIQSNPLSENLYNLCKETLGNLLFEKPTDPEINWGKIISPVGLNCRDNAMLNANVVGILQEGQRFHITKDCGDWYQIDMPFKGFIYKEYTQTSQTPKSVSDELLSFTKSWEGFSSTPYQDAGGNWTIGYGICSYSEKPASNMTQQEASEQLKETLNNLASQIFELYSKYNLCQSEFDSLVDFAYNLGLGALKGSDLVANFETCDNTQTILGDFTAWSYCDGKQLPGLVRRRISESDMWLKGEYNNNN